MAWAPAPAARSSAPTSIDRSRDRGPATAGSERGPTGGPPLFLEGSEVMPRSIIAACGLALLAAGCGSSNRPLTSDDADQILLRDVGELCRHYQASRKKPPQK